MSKFEPLTDTAQKVAAIVADALSKCRKRTMRQQVAQKVGISIHLLNAYASPPRERWDPDSGQKLLHRKAAFPARLIERFCEVTEDDTLQRFVLGERLRLLLEIGETEAEQRRRLSKLAQAGRKKRKK